MHSKVVIHSDVQNNWGSVVKSVYCDVNYIKRFPKTTDLLLPFTICYNITHGDTNPALFRYTYFFYKKAKYDAITDGKLNDDPESKKKYLLSLKEVDYNNYVYNAAKCLSEDFGKMVDAKCENLLEDYKKIDQLSIKERYEKLYEKKIAIYDNLYFKRPLSTLISLLIGFLSSLTVWVLTTTNENKTVVICSWIILIVAIVTLFIFIGTQQVKIKNKIKEIIENDNTEDSF